MPAARLTEASVKNAISGITDAGLKPSVVEFSPDGSIRFEFSEAASEPTNGSFVGLSANQEPPSWEDAL